MLKDLLRTSDLSASDLTALLDRSAELKRAPHSRRDLLKGEAVVMYFSKPSTRTRISFEVAIARLGGLPVTVAATDLQLGRGETIEDTARVISRYAKAFVIRTFRDADVETFAKAASIPVVNALTDGHHPCQSVADLLTLREKFGSLEGLKLVYLGAGNNVAHSLLEAGALAGMRVVVAAPAKLSPSSEVVLKARAVAEKTGGSVEVTEDPKEAVKGADALYTDVWLSMGDPDEEKAMRKELLGPYQVGAEQMARAKPGAVFMHCLPAHRGDEVTAEVIDGPASVVFDQAENRLHTEAAILVALLERTLEGSANAS
ncbi:MAG: ornithine carbamoyltransferase [Polyangiaceae bacterium]|nr:ornithine carbamoyltransferase [Polyangiaceae bacterium]NUQ72244.1 ornithine carbamoyltransferase [Polyangiaceae bacterium]